MYTGNHVESMQNIHHILAMYMSIRRLSSTTTYTVASSAITAVESSCATGTSGRPPHRPDVAGRVFHIDANPRV